MAGIISILHKAKPKRPKHPMTQEEKSVSTQQFGWKFVPPMLPLHFPPFSVPLGNPLLKWLLPACFMLRCPHNYTHLMTSVNKIINWHLKSSWKIDKYNFSWRKPQLFSFTKRRTCWINPFRLCTPSIFSCQRKSPWRKREMDKWTFTFGVPIMCRQKCIAKIIKFAAIHIFSVSLNFTE